MKLTSVGYAGNSSTTRNDPRKNQTVGRHVDSNSEGVEISFSAALKGFVEQVGSSSVSARDLTRMSRAEMESFSNELYQAGEIDLTQLRVLDLMGGDIGSLSSNGVAHFYSKSEVDSVNSGTFNYLARTEAGIKSAEKTASEASQHEAVKSLRKLLAVLKKHQASISTE